MQPTVLYIGYKLRAMRALPPKGTGRLVDKAKIEAAKIKNLEEAEERALTVPTFGALEDFCILNDVGRMIAEVDYDKDGDSPAVQLITLLRDYYDVPGFSPVFTQPFLSTSSAQRPYEIPSFYLVGFNVREMMRVVCFEIFCRNAVSDDPVEVPASFFRGEHMLIDIYEQLVHTVDRPYLDLRTLLNALSISWTLESLSTPIGSAKLAFELARCTQLFEYCKTAD